MTEKAKQDDKVELLSKDEILAAPDLVFEIVEVPEWGGKVRVKALTGTERDAFESSMLKGAGKNQKISTQDIRAKLCARTIVDMEDKRLFNDGEIGKLGAKSAAALDRVYTVAARLSKISSEDVEELAKNSGIGLSEDS
jgi:hypothetical protein